MFKLFSNIFAQPEPDQFRLPKALLKAAIERAVDGTDPRLRIMPGYAETLRHPVLHAIKHVVQLAKSLPEPVPISGDSLPHHPALATIFYSRERLSQNIQRDAALREFRKSKPYVHDNVSALLAVRRVEKHVVGTALVNGSMRTDVAKTTVSFDRRWFIYPAQREVETRRLLMRRVFDSLLGLALSRLMERDNERTDLTARKALLQSKLKMINRHGSLNDRTLAAEQGKLQARMNAIEHRLSTLGPNRSVLPSNLETVVEVLASAEKYMWLEETSLCLDRFYVKHSVPGALAPQLTFQEFHDSVHPGVLVLMVKIAFTGDFPGAEQTVPFRS